MAPCEDDKASEDGYTGFDTQKTDQLAVGASDVAVATPRASSRILWARSGSALQAVGLWVGHAHLTRYARET